MWHESCLARVQKFFGIRAAIDSAVYGVGSAVAEFLSMRHFFGCYACPEYTALRL